MGVAITTGARHAAHLVTLVINTVIIGGLCIWVTHKGRQRDPYPFSKWKKWGPSILCWLSFPFIMADPMRHVLGDYDIWQGCSRSCGEIWPDRCNWSSNEYKCVLVCGETWSPPYNSTYIPDKCNQQADGYLPRVDDCTCVHDSQESARHLSIMGVIFTIFFTYFGFALFLVGNLWNANILEKCRDARHKYRVLRGLSVDSEY